MITRYAIISLIVLEAMIPCGALANQASYDACQTAAGGIDDKLRICDRAELSNRDAALNAVYKTVLNLLQDSRKQKLRQSQRAWLTFRDLECAFRLSAETGGTDAPLVRDTCILQLDDVRIADLDAALRVASH